MTQRKFILFAAPALVLAMAFACKKAEEPVTTDTAVAATTETSSTASTANAAPATVSEDDKTFATKAADGGMTEVSLGGIAASKATNADVKSFSQRMQTDHGKAGDELKSWASAKGVTLPAEISAEHKKLADDLSKKSGAAFDKAYMNAMVEDHDKDVKEFQEASTKVKDPDLKAWIDKTLPVITDHQKMAHEIAGKLK